MIDPAKQLLGERMPIIPQGACGEKMLWLDHDNSPGARTGGFASKAAGDPLALELSADVSNRAVASDKPTRPAAREARRPRPARAGPGRR